VAKEKLGEVKTLLDESKTNIKISFDSLKEVISYLKK
jgi:uncharacterized membrane protein YvbJ